MAEQSGEQGISDADLVLRAIQGQKDAFGDLYERYLDQIYRYAYYRVANPNDAEDLTETIFLKAWNALQKTKQPPKNVRAWIYRIAHNTVIDHYRMQKQTVSLAEVEMLPETAPQPEKQVQSNQESQRLAEAIQKLDHRLQQVVVCRFINGMSHAETAEIMNLSEGHVRVLQHRALKRVREILATETS